jgi:hypothetical protein
MKDVPRNKFVFGSRRKRKRSLSQIPKISIFDLLLNIEARIRGEWRDKSSLGGRKRAVVVRVPVQPPPVHTSRYVE